MPPKAQTLTIPVSIEPLNEPAEKTPFAIDDEASADWLLARLAAIDAERNLLCQQHEARLKRLDHDHQCLLNLFQDQLQKWAAVEVMKDKRGRKSIHLAHGTLSFRSVPAGLKVTDIQQALAFAKQYRPETVRTVESLDLANYRQWAESRLHCDGEVLPGVEFCPEREAFSIRFGKDAK